MTPRRIEAVLFDAVGTLIEPAVPVGETYARVAAAHRLDVSSDAIEAAFRRVFPEMPPMAFPDAPPNAVRGLERAWWRELVRRAFRGADPGADERVVDAMFPVLFDAFAAPRAWRTRPGAREALAGLARSGRRRAVLSNFDHRLHRILEGLKLARSFEFVLLPGEARAAKPDPRMFRIALTKLALPGAAVALVGDDERDDLGGARASGIHGVDARRLATLTELETRLAAIERAADSDAGAADAGGLDER